MGVVGIVCRTKNRPLFLHRAINSVKKQTYDNWRLVIVNDGGNEAIVDDVISSSGKGFSHKIKVVHNGESVGMEAASNIGLKELDVDFYAIHDDDDSWAPNFLERCVYALEKKNDHNVEGVVARTEKIREVVREGEIVFKGRSRYLPEVNSFTIARVVQNNPFVPIAFVYSKKALDFLQCYDESLPVVGDWEFNLRFIRQFDIYFVSDTTAYYHVRSDVNGDSSDNSITKDLLHQHYRSIVVNRYMRQALEEKTLTLGHIFSSSEPSLHSNRFGEKLNYFYPKLRYLHPRNIIDKFRGKK